MKKEVYFVNKIIRQGNSLCVRVPSSIIREGNLTEGMEVLMSVVPKEETYDYDSASISYLTKIADKVKSLDRYTENEKKLFLVLNFEFLKFAKGQNKAKKAEEYEKMLKSEFGKAFTKRFFDFETKFSREAFIIEKDETAVLKPEYR